MALLCAQCKRVVQGSRYIVLYRFTSPLRRVLDTIRTAKSTGGKRWWLLIVAIVVFALLFCFFFFFSPDSHACESCPVLKLLCRAGTGLSGIGVFCLLAFILDAFLYDQGMS